MPCPLRPLPLLARRLGLLALLGLSLVLLPACSGRQARRGNAGLEDPLLGGPTVPYSAYRPRSAPAPPRRTMVLGGYAGYRYDRGVPTRNVPTAYGAEPCLDCPPAGSHDPAAAPASASATVTSSRPGMESGYGFEAPDEF